MNHAHLRTRELLSQASTRENVNLGSAATAHDLDPALARACRDLATQGSVLLMNDGALPLQPGSSVALFGRCARDWIAVGYGSGGDVNPPYVSNLADALGVSGAVVVDEKLAARYREFSAENPADPGTEWGKWPTHYPEMALSDREIADAAARNDVAVVVIARAAGEDRDAELAPGSYYLTPDEESLLTRVTAAFSRTVVVLDIGNVMDMSWAEHLPISALLLAWAGGMEAGHAVADVLTGVAEPGGRLTSTIVRDYRQTPSAAHFGDPDVTVYAEDVFVGYRYFTTFGAKAVQFPFGAGLGYGRFTRRVSNVAVRGTEVTVQVSATNVGERTSSDVVQLYLESPAGKLPQPARRLAGFARTDAVAPGGEESVEIRCDLQDFAAFDEDGRAGHRSCFVLEAGDYRLHVGSDALDTELAETVRVPETIVVRRAHEAAAPVVAFERLTRDYEKADGIIPVLESAPQRLGSLKEWIVAALPAPLPHPGRDIRLDEVRAGTATLEEFVGALTQQDLVTLVYGDVTMDSPWGVRGNAGALGGVSETLQDKGVAPAITTDGPSGLRVANYASLLPCGTALASTWNPAAVRNLAALHGAEMKTKGSDILLSPGMNIQRDPLCGRNFEYFSEDPLLTGLFGAAIVGGVQSAGVSACPKHFAANNQEYNRIHNDSRMSARALREIYLRGFEIMVKAAQPRAIMTSYNKINGTWGHYHYDLVTTILRGEWGFDGVVMTDWWMRMAPDPDFPGVHDSGYRIRAGVDVLMPGSREHGGHECDTGVTDSLGDFDGALTLAELQQCALHVVRFVLDANPRGHLLVRDAGAAAGRRNLL